MEILFAIGIVALMWIGKGLAAAAVGAAYLIVATVSVAIWQAAIWLFVLPFRLVIWTVALPFRIIAYPFRETA